MNHPQSWALNRAKELKKEMEIMQNIGDNACCALVFLWCLGLEPEKDDRAIETIKDAIKEGVISKDCTVKWAEFGKWLTGRTVTVDFVPITNLQGIIERTPVRYDYKGRGHWVGVEHGMICFNPLEHSQCVEKGSPVTKRVLHISGVTK